MTGDDTAQPDVTDREGPSEPQDALHATIEDVFDRLMALDGAIGTLADAECGMVQALEHVDAVAVAYRGQPEHAETLRQLDELRDLAYRTLAELVGAGAFAVGTGEGPPARGSSPKILSPPRARRDTIADSPRALRDAARDSSNAAPEAAHARSSGMAPTRPWSS